MKINRARLTDNPPPEWVGNIELAPEQIALRVEDDGHVDLYATSNEPAFIIAVLLSTIEAIAASVDEGLIVDERAP